MKNRILLFATLIVLLANLGACIASRHPKDTSNGKTSAEHRDQVDHMHDNEPR